MLEFLKTLFLVLHFSYYKLMTFLMMLSVILLSMLMILTSTLIVIWHLICGNNERWLLNLTLIYKTLLTGEEGGLLILVLQKLCMFCWMSLITLVRFMWEWLGLLLRKNHLLRCWGCLSLINKIAVFTLSLLLKQPPRKFLWGFFFLSLLCVLINLPYSLVWNTVIMPGLVLLAATWKC